MKAKYKRIKRNEIINTTKPQNIKVFNYGLAILKAIYAFLVVRHHSFDPKTTKNKIIRHFTKERLLHVPSFFILSFYFTSKSLLSLKPKIILNRLIRLFIPYIGWALIIFKTNRLFNKKFKTKLKDSYFHLKLQLIWGQGYVPQLWFLNALIAMTLLFILTIFIFRKHTLFILQIILVLSYIPQYTGYLYKNIVKKYPYYNNLVLAYFFASIPLCITGFILGYFKVIDLLQKYKIKTLILSLIIYNVVEDYNIFANTSFMAYQGINLNIKCICIIFIFSLFPSEKITNKYLAKFLIQITNYTGGVFYLHIPIRDYCKVFLDSVKNQTFLGVAIIYLICYFICFVGMLIFGKTPIKYLFC